MLVLSQKRGRWSARHAHSPFCYVMARGEGDGYTRRLIVLDGELAVP
jgi:hypothetical protein